MSRLPAHWASTGYGVPTVCARHGEPEVVRRKVVFQSKPPGWAIPLVVLGVIVYAIVVMAMRKTVTVPGWPFCAQCKSRRAALLGWGLGVLFGGIVLFFLGASLTGGSDSASAMAILGPLLLLLSVFVVIAGVGVTVRSNWVVLAGGVVSRDGAWLDNAKADPRFDAYVEAATAHAMAQEQARQQQPPYPQQPGYQIPSHQQQPSYQQPGYPQPGYQQGPTDPTQLYQQPPR